MQPDDVFAGAYQRDAASPGAPCYDLMAFLDQCPRTGEALDIGAGIGRNALPLAERGLRVLAVDLSDAGIEALRGLAARRGVSDRIEARVGDFRTMDLPAGRFSVVVAATVLDHVPLDDARAVLARLAVALADDGVLFVEVLTTDDAGFTGEGPVSECQSAIAHYFRPGELASLCADRLRIIRYEEKWEWDRTHGPEHLHGKASLLAVRRGARPEYFGIPPSTNG